MEEQVTWSLKLSKEELYLLSSLLQATSLMGFEDPFDGMLADETEQRLEEVREGLAAKKYMEIEPDGTISLDGAVAALVEAATTARRTLVASHTLAGEAPLLRLIHLSPELLVEQEAISESEVRLTAVRDMDTVAQRLRGFLELPEAAAAPGSALTMPKEDFEEAQRLAVEEGREPCRTFLGKAGVSPEAVASLSAALMQDVESGSVSVLHQEAREVRYGDSLSWLIGSEGTWRVQPHQQGEAVRLQPCTTAEIGQRVDRMVSELGLGKSPD